MSGDTIKTIRGHDEIQTPTTIEMVLERGKAAYQEHLVTVSEAVGGNLKFAVVGRIILTEKSLDYRDRDFDDISDPKDILRAIQMEHLAEIAAFEYEGLDRALEFATLFAQCPGLTAFRDYRKVMECFTCTVFSLNAAKNIDVKSIHTTDTSGVYRVKYEPAKVIETRDVGANKAIRDEFCRLLRLSPVVNMSQHGANLPDVLEAHWGLT